MAIVLETPFDPQALYAALSYLSNVLNASSWQNLLKMFFIIALINGIVSMAMFRQVDYIKQFIVALVFSSVLAIPIGETIVVKRADTEKIYTINNSKAPLVLVYSFGTVNSVTKWFTKMAGASINSPTYTGMYDAGIGSNANIIRNSMDVTFRDPAIRSDLTHFIKECTLYDIRDGVVSLEDLMSRGNGFELIFSNTSPARFVSIRSLSGSAELKTCKDAATYLNSSVDRDVGLSLQGKAANFFYTKDVAPMVIYSTAIQNSYNTQLSINENVSKIVKQNMFNHLLEASGQDIAKLVSDPAMAENAAIHMGVSRSAKKAAFQQSVVSQLGKELLPAMSSWMAIIIVMLFPFVVLFLVVSRFGNIKEVFTGYLGTLFWICLWQPIFAIINNLANWELGRQLAKTGAFAKEGIPYGYVNTVYDSLINNHSLVGWMVILTPMIASAVAYGSYRGITSMGGSMFSPFSGSTSSVGNEMSDGNLSMGNTTLGNRSINSVSDNNTQINQMNTSPSINSGVFTSNNGTDTISLFNNGQAAVINTATSNVGGLYKLNTSYGQEITDANTHGGQLELSKGQHYQKESATGNSISDSNNFGYMSTQGVNHSSQTGLSSNSGDIFTRNNSASDGYSTGENFTGSESNAVAGTIYANANANVGIGSGGNNGSGMPNLFSGGSGRGKGFGLGASIGANAHMTQAYQQAVSKNDNVIQSSDYQAGYGTSVSFDEHALSMTTNQLGEQSSYGHNLAIDYTQSTMQSSGYSQGASLEQQVGFNYTDSLRRNTSVGHTMDAGHHHHKDALMQHLMQIDNDAATKILNQVGYANWDEYISDLNGYKTAQKREQMNALAFNAIKQAQQDTRPNRTFQKLDDGFQEASKNIPQVGSMVLPERPKVVTPNMHSHTATMNEHGERANQIAQQVFDNGSVVTNKAINSTNQDPSAVKQIRQDKDSWVNNGIAVIENAMGLSNYTPK